MKAVELYADEELVQAIRQNQNLNKAISFIYQHHAEKISSFLINYGASQQQAEDVFQEVVVAFIDLVQKNKFRGEASVKTFLFALNRNIWLNELKKRGRAMQRELNNGKDQDREDLDASHLIVHREARTQVIEIVDQLGGACKKILLMFYYENLSMKEILEKTEYETEQVVRNKKYKCLKQLEQMLNEKPLLKESFKKALHG